MGEEHRLRMFENKVPRTIFGPMKEEITQEWRKLHTREFHKFTAYQIL